MASDPSPPDARRRTAYSLIEVIAAIALMSATLVPAVSLVRDAMDTSIECDERQLLALYAVSQVEQRVAMISYNWSTGSASDDYAADGHANIRFNTVADDQPASGGVAGLLMDIRSTVYLDADADDVLDADELSCQYRTKLGRFATYEALSP